ncbi:MAG: Hpt domain-containing protein [Polyangiaceae bacterium]|jgi:HPt (histidine-containing phosphotransfer) domain-containing protein
MTELRDSPFEALLAAERAAYAERIHIRIAELEGYLEAGHVEEARRVAHRLAGSAGTYGFPALGGAAREIEVTLENGSPIDEPMLRRLREACPESAPPFRGAP